VEVRYHPVFELQTAMDMLLEVVAPLTSLTLSLAGIWNIKGTNQASMDSVIREARTKAAVVADQYAQGPKGRGTPKGGGAKGYRAYQGGKGSTPVSDIFSH